jgi:hypothetical protein
VQGQQPEHYSGEVLLVTAYAIVWFVLFVWIGLAWRKLARTSARLSELEQVIDRAATSGPSASPKAR